jgi:hypothetical protein
VKGLTVLYVKNRLKESYQPVIPKLPIHPVLLNPSAGIHVHPAAEAVVAPAVISGQTELVNFKRF